MYYLLVQRCCVVRLVQAKDAQYPCKMLASAVSSEIFRGFFSSSSSSDIIIHGDLSYSQTTEARRQQATSINIISFLALSANHNTSSCQGHHSVNHARSQLHASVSKKTASGKFLRFSNHGVLHPIRCRIEQGNMRFTNRQGAFDNARGGN